MATSGRLSTASSRPSYNHWGRRSQREEPYPRYTGTNRIVPTNYRQLLYKPPLNIVWDDLGMCSPDIVGNYLQLDAKLLEFARSQVYAVDIMQNELQVIADILVLLEQELQSDAARHNNLLLETMQQD